VFVAGTIHARDIKAQGLSRYGVPMGFRIDYPRDFSGVSRSERCAAYLESCQQTSTRTFRINLPASPPREHRR
jgi:hypothetical protein